MTGNELLYFGFSSFSIGLSLFCANLLFLRKEHRHVYWPLGLFFLANAISSVPLVLAIIDKVYQTEGIARVLLPLNPPLAMMLAPLFWLYVRGLTTESSYADLPYKALHAAPVLVGACVSLMLVMLPADVFQALQADQHVDHPLVPFLGVGLWTIAILTTAQITIYLSLIVRLLISYNTRLKDMFASTENRELNWIWWIILVSVCYVTFNVANVVMELLEVQLLPKNILEQPFVDLFTTIAIFWLLALWGLRQKPGLLRDGIAATGDNRQPPPRGQKYERSALSEEQAQRLARKIKSAMQDDLLHRDPNLSLRDLSKHIGVTSNYLSQTLNETIGSNFFDYVNFWRIEDAVERVQKTDESVLEIAYDVGFNSKSAFYKAFKRNVRMTPSTLREARGRLTVQSINVPVAE